MTHPAYRSRVWPKIRLQILERDGWICQVRGPKCKRIADQVDHIVGLAQGGSWYDPSNLRASCTPCNAGRGDHTGQERWRRSSTRIVLVVGPPCAGKTLRVEQSKSHDDLVVDYERIAEAVGGNHEAAMKARNAILSDIRGGKVTAKRAWIISANPKAEEIFPYHDRMVVDPGIDAVMQRTNDPATLERIGEWYGVRFAENPGPSKPSRDWLGTMAGH